MLGSSSYDPVELLSNALDEVHYDADHPLDSYTGHHAIWTIDMTSPNQTSSHPGPFDVKVHSGDCGFAIREWCNLSQGCRPDSIQAGSVRIAIVLAQSGDALSTASSAEKCTIKTLIESFALPSATISFYIKRAAQFASFPGPGSGRDHKAYVLSMRWWTACWRYDSKTKSSVGIVFVEYAHVGDVQDQLARKLKQMHGLIEQPCFVGLVVALLERRQMTGWVHRNELNSQDADNKLMEYMNTDLSPDPAEDSLDINNRAFWITMHNNRLNNLQLLLAAMSNENASFRRELEDVSETYEGSLLVDNAVEHLSQSIHADILLCAAIRERATMQLATLMNIVGQRDTNLSIQIAASSRELAAESKEDQKLSIAIANASRSIAADAKRDSASMKTIAAVTMIFLPGTFVATVFSMPVFNLSKSAATINVAPQIWIYWAVTIPLTCLTVCAWWLWQRMHHKMEKRDPACETFDSWLGSNHSKEKSA